MTSPNDASQREELVNEAIAAYLEAVDAGRPLDRAEFLARYPDLAAELEAFLDDRERFARAAGELGALPPRVVSVEAGRAAEVPTLAPGETPAPLPGTTIRYFGDYELLE